MRQLFVGSILLSTALHSAAVTLGRQNGAAVIGRPLDVRVEASTGSGEDLAAACVRSEVFYGEGQLASSAVRVVPQRSAPDAKSSIRIQTTVPVNEPVVSVVVYVGCDAPFSRRYVLLADPLVESTATAPSVGEATTGQVRLPGVGMASGGDGFARSLPRLANAERSSGAGAARRSGANAQAASGDGGAPVRKAPVASVVRKPLPDAPAKGPRLHLDSPDLSLAVERDPVLKLSLAMLSEPSTSEQDRAAAGQLWKAINSTPEDILRDTQKLSVLEAESKGLRDKEKADEARIASLQGEVDQTRYITWLAYLLGALLLLSLLGLWFFRRRREESEPEKRAGAWWDGAQKPSSKMTSAVVSSKAAQVDRADMDLDLDLGGDSSFDELHSLHDSSLNAVLDSRASDRNTTDLSAAGSRSLATEELFDVQQQADFFVSLGENDKAVRVLKEHLAESQEPSPLAFLDLFKLYHKQGNRADYEALREDFNHKFNAGAPTFEHYSDVSVGLEGYETAFGRIQALWPQPRVLDVIEKSIFRDADDDSTEMFDLEAYRELLLLHAMAKDMIGRPAFEEPQVDFEHTAIKPLKAAANMGLTGSDRGGPRTEPIPDEHSMPMASPRLGLDVDLDALAEMSAFEASLPEVPEFVEASAPLLNQRSKTSVADEGNLIDFEVMDFMPPPDQDPTLKP